MARSRQFAHLQEKSRATLQGLIPADCPLLVALHPQGGFQVRTLDERSGHVGRFQVVAAWIDGYVAAWTRITRQPHPTDRPPPVG